MSHPVDPDGMQARVAGNHLQEILGGRIMIKDGLDVFANSIEHDCSRFWAILDFRFWIEVGWPPKI
jgi:hypothetical protein